MKEKELGALLENAGSSLEDMKLEALNPPGAYKRNIRKFESLSHEELNKHRGEWVIVYGEGVVIYCPRDKHISTLGELELEGVDLSSVYSEYLRKPGDPFVIL